MERQIAAQDVRDEENWDVNKLLNVNHPTNLPGVQNFIQTTPVPAVKELSEFVGNNIYFEGQPSMNRKIVIDWPTNVFATSNFMYACAGADNSRFSVNDYFRPIGAYLVFGDGSVLLLSERETDKVLGLTWQMPKAGTFSLVHWTYARKQKPGGKISLRTPPSIANSFSVSDETLAALDILQGEVMFPRENRQNCVIEMLSSRSAKLFAPHFCSMRGLGFKYSRSDLEVICTSVAFDEQ